MTTGSGSATAISVSTSCAQALRSGERLSAVTARLARALGIETTILPATDDRLRTWIDTR